jgi:predicted lipid-binding transport protein (Tim44 family)
MTSHPLRTYAALVAAGLATVAMAAGCAPSTSSSSNSTSKFSGDARQAAQAVEDLQSAANDGDNEKICQQILSTALAGRLGAHGRSCPDAVDAAVKDADTIDMTVEKVDVTSGKATAQVKLETGKKDRTATFQLVRENGRWKIQSL